MIVESNKGTSFHYVVIVGKSLNPALSSHWLLRLRLCPVGIVLKMKKTGTKTTFRPAPRTRPPGVHGATNWLLFDGSQNSIFRLSFEFNLSLNIFLIRVRYDFTALVLYFASYKLRKSKEMLKNSIFSSITRHLHMIDY